MTELESSSVVQELTPQQQTDQISTHSSTSSKSYTKVLINDKSYFNDFLDLAWEAPLITYDTETNGKFTPFDVQLVGVSFALPDGDDASACYIPVGHFDGDQLDISYVLDGLKPLMESDKAKLCHHAKYDEMVFGVYDIEVKGMPHDTLIMLWLLDESQSKGLKTAVQREFGYQMRTYEDVIDAAPRKKGVKKDYSFAKVPIEDALGYACDDSYWTYRLYLRCKEKMQAEKVWPAYINIEAPSQRVLRHIEKVGAYIDKEAIEDANERLPKIVERVEASIYEQAGEVFNIGSGAQLGPILFEKLGIGKNVPKTATGKYSTDKKTLETYAPKHQIVEDILRRKKITKTHSTFVEGLQNHLAPDGRLHASFNGCGTVTGRLSSSNPNLQNIEGDEVEEIRVRNFFVPTPGYRFVVADYGQVEYRLMAHFSQDAAMLEAFAAGHDFHAETARKVFSVPPDEEVIHRQRFIAKSINFGIGYGRGPKSLAETLGCSMDEAREYIADYYRTFKGLAAFKDHVVSQARQVGYIRTLSGRKRRLLPDIRSNNWALRGRAERQAFNTKIQGSAADIIKLAMIALEPKLDDLGARMIIQIHDELVIEAPEDDAEKVLETAQFTMENPLNNKNPLRLPLVVDPKIVDRWGDAK